jgi:hypothetical protein
LKPKEIFQSSHTPVTNTVFRNNQGGSKNMLKKLPAAMEHPVNARRRMV